jgi:hypothetical protein
MTSEQASKAFALRMALSQAGIPWRACSPNGELVSFATVSEAGINFLISDYPEATETGIFADGGFTIVDEVPLTPEQAEERRRAEEEAAEQALLDEEKARQEALVEAGRASERQRKEAARRAAGKPTRAEWLAASRPWEKVGMSRNTYYRHRKRDWVGTGGSAPQASPIIAVLAMVPRQANTN